MKKDNRICRGDYESARHYACAECFVKGGGFRKNPKIPLVGLIILAAVIISVAAYIVF